MSGKRIGIILGIAACIGIFSYLASTGQLLPFAASAFGIAWWSFKISFFSILAISVFFLLHPLRFMLQLRGTPAGQRGHLRFDHLFGLLWLDAGGDRNAQEVRLGIWRWSWRIAGQARERPPRQQTPLQPSPPPPAPTPSGEAARPSSPTKDSPAGNPPPTRSEPPPLADAVPPSAPKPADTKLPEPAVSSPPAADEAMPPEDVAPLTPDVSEDPVRLSPEIPPFVPPVESPFPRTSAKEPEAPREKSFGEKIRADLRRLRRRAADGWHKAKTYLNLGRRVWRRASPMIKRLASDHWNGLHILPSLCRIRYGLSEAHLTGLTQGLAAPFAGLLRPFSIHLEPIPVFTGSTIHVFIRGGFFIQPWRILWAWLVLLTTIDFWKALRDLWRWKKARSAVPGNA